MMIPRFFCPAGLPETGVIKLPAEVAHHADKVLRMKAGQSLVLFDGNGREVSATLVALGRQASAALGAWSAPARESPLEAVLVQALASGDKMDWIIQKAVELGVGAIAPVVSERCVLKLSGERAEKRLRHWQQVVIAACEQSGRNRVPVVEAPLSLSDFLARESGASRLALVPDASCRLAARARPAGRCEILVGPEGGWSDRDLALIAGGRCEPVSLGPRVLRTETAGLAALAVMQAAWGDF